jgi:hypothetical protein
MWSKRRSNFQIPHLGPFLGTYIIPHPCTLRSRAALQHMPKSYIYIGSHSSGKQHHIRDTAGEQQRGVYKNRSEVCHEPRPAVANTFGSV